MKQIVIILSMLFAACSVRQSTDALLENVWSRDQTVRKQMLELTRAVTVEGRTELVDSLITLSDMVERVDVENMRVVDSLLKEGVPKHLTPQSYKTIWIVIDHASLDKQVQHLPTIEQMSNDGLIGWDEYAILYDRVAMKRNLPQRYGSQTVQFGSAETQKLYVWPVESAIKLDSLRASVGLSSMEEYIELLEKTTGITANFDSNMTVEQLNQLRGLN